MISNILSFMGYKGNPKLKKPGAPLDLSANPEIAVEMAKCINDPIYFIKNYCKIVHVDRGLVNFELYPYQERYCRELHNNRFVVAKWPRQSGKSTTTAAYILHYVLFNAQKTVFILANKAATSREILSRVQKAYENLPWWMQQGVIQWNKGRIELENGSLVEAAATSSSAIRGRSANIVLIDEVAFVPPNQYEEFFESTYPTISSGSETKVFMVSTPKGMNHFYTVWDEAVKKKSEFVPVEIGWNEVPGRDENFKKKTIANVGLETWLQEYEGEFQGSVGTLISGQALKNMTSKDPIFIREGLKVYEKPIMDDSHPDADHQYVLVADTSEGTGGDYSAFHVIDITKYPFRQVASYRDNLVSPLYLPNIIYTVAKEYNNAWVLIEINSSGKQIADILRFDLEYENVLMSGTNEKKRQQLMFGSGNELIPGVRTTKSTKKIGCSNFKHLVENGLLEIVDMDTIMEISTFVRVRDSYEAETDAHDDTVMPLVIFGWLSGQEYFSEMANKDIRSHLFAKMAARFEEEMPMELYSTKLDWQSPDRYVDSNGIVWSS